MKNWLIFSFINDRGHRSVQLMRGENIDVENDIVEELQDDKFYHWTQTEPPSQKRDRYIYLSSTQNNYETRKMKHEYTEFI